MIVLSAHPLQQFKTIYQTNVMNYAPIVSTNVVAGKKTPVLASAHPYVFYGLAQSFDQIGSGIMPPGNVAAATAQMQKDLAVSGWVKSMYDDPTQDAAAVWSNLMAFWRAPAQQPTVKALVDHQGSLFYTDPDTLAFTYKVPLVWPS